MVFLKRLLFFFFTYGVVLATWGVFLASPGYWFDQWWLRQYGSYGPLVMGTNYQPVTVILLLCAAMAVLWTWLILAGPVLLRRMFSGPRIGPMGGFSVPLAIPRGRRRRVRP